MQAITVALNSAINRSCFIVKVKDGEREAKQITVVCCMEASKILLLMQSRFTGFDLVGKY